MKQCLLGITAILLAVSLSAFSVKKHTNSAQTDSHYYGFTGSDNTDLNQTGSWVDLGQELPSQCGGNNVVCIVSAPQTNLSDFQTAISSANPQSEAQLDAMSGVDIYSRKNP